MDLAAGKTSNFPVRTLHGTAATHLGALLLAM